MEKPKALSDWTYQIIRNRIINLELLPGEQLNLDPFIDELQVSRTPIREAFLKLANEGLVDIRPRVGYFVSEVTEEDIRDLFEIREIVENRAAHRSASTLTDGELEELQHMLEEEKKAVEDGDLALFLKFDTRFHNQLLKHITNRRLLALIDSVYDLTYRERNISIRSLDNVRLTLVEHQRILDALMERDGDKAAWFMGEHLKNVSDRIINILNKEKATIKEI